MELKAAKVTTTISNLKTKEKYKTEEEWKAKGIPEKDIRRDVHVLMPKLDLFSKTKQVQNLGEIMTKPHRQRYGFGSFIKKITKPIKKVVKSPLGKAAFPMGLLAIFLTPLTAFLMMLPNPYACLCGFVIISPKF